MHMVTYSTFSAAAKRSASGSWAIIKLLPSLSAVRIARSRAPASSGFGNDTVGKSGSGLTCSGTDVKSLMPTERHSSGKTRPPTPCKGVYTKGLGGLHSDTVDFCSSLLVLPPISDSYLPHISKLHWYTEAKPSHMHRHAHSHLPASPSKRLTKGQDSLQWTGRFPHPLECLFGRHC